MYARIKFVEEYLESKSHELPALTSGKRSHRKVDGEEHGESKKKIKGNE